MAPRLLLVSIGMLSLGLAGCPNVPEPKQREDWVVPPTKYGDVQFQGLAAPDRMNAQDAGAD
jgi:hypothetical protein